MQSLPRISLGICGHRHIGLGDTYKARWIYTAISQMNLGAEDISSSLSSVATDRYMILSRSLTFFKS